MDKEIKKEKMIALSEAVLAEPGMTDEQFQSYLKQMSEIINRKYNE